jgi:hypothetical protein
MKWLKHMTATWDDERVARLVDKGGMEGLSMYGLYWRVQEILAAQMEGKDPSCSVRYTVTRWSLLLSLRGSLVFSALSRLGLTGLVTVERDGDEILVTNRNLLKYRDEYSKKSRQSPDNVLARTKGEGEAEQNREEQDDPVEELLPIEKSARKEEKIIVCKALATQCEEIYQAYPRHTAPKIAYKAIEKVLRKKPFDELLAIVQMYATQTQKRIAEGKLEKEYIPHPATWFNQGRYDDDDLKPPPQFEIVEVSPEQWWGKESTNGAH